MPPPHLHRLLRGQQLLLLFSNLKDEARIARQRLVIPRGSRRLRPAPSAVGRNLAEAWTSDPHPHSHILLPGLPFSPPHYLPNDQGTAHTSLCGQATKPGEVRTLNFT